MNAVELIIQTIDTLSETMRQSMREYRENPEYDALFRLTITQLHYLHSIKEHPSISASELAAFFHVQKPTVTNILNRLMQQGYVTRLQSKEDRRLYHLYLTKVGEQLLYLENTGYASFAQKAVNCLSVNEQQQLTTLLNKIK
jgi:DNA-binding MarR family transcriptional regulator